MADNVEVKLEQLTDAIRSLYSRPSLTQSEINNLMTSLAQKFENSSEFTNQKFIGVIVNETKKVLEEKQLEMRQQLTGFENLIKQMTQGLANPKMSMEVTKILNEVTDMYAKLGAQEIALQKINQTLITNKSANPINEIVKLSNEFNVFSRGFENITHTLNKNFTDFLNQVKGFNSKEELTDIQLELDTINSNVNSIISALAIIDHKYRDLTGLVESFNSKEAVFDQSLQGIKQITNTFEEVKDGLVKSATKEDVGEIKEGINFVSENINKLQGNIDETINQNSQKVANAINSIETKLSANAGLEDINNLKGEIKTLIDKLSLQNTTNKDELIAKIQENLKTSSADKTQKISEDILNLKNKLDLIEQNIQKLPKEDILNEIKIIENGLKTLTKDSLSSIVELISSEFSSLDKTLENKDSENNRKVDFAINNLRDDIKSFEEKFASLKEEISSASQGNINALKEPLEKALKELRETTIDEQLNIINQNIKDTTSSINSSFEQIKENFKSAASSTNVEILAKLNNTIPAISEKLEVLRGYLTQENAQNSQELKNYFKETSETIKSYIEDIKNSQNSPLSEIKVDIQNLSSYLIESVENININISKEFEEYKGEIKNFLDKLENSNLDGTEIKDALVSIKNDLIEGILGSTKNAKANFIIIEEKINEILEKQSSTNDEVVLEVINNILEKIEHTNQQQIHNAKELLEEIQNNGSEIRQKIDTLIRKEPQQFEIENEILHRIEIINEKLEPINSDRDEELKESIELLKEHLETLTKEMGEQISDKLNEITDKNDEFSTEKKPDVDEYLSKINEYLTNVEYLKNNLSEDLKESIETIFNAKSDEAKVETYNIIQKISNVENDINKITSNISRIINTNDDTSYAYSLQDVESDIAKLRLTIERNLKGDNYKEFINRLIELKNINIENNKLNHTLETNINHLNAWFKSAAQKLEGLSQQIENAEKMSMEEIKTRLIRSEKSADGTKIDEATRRQISYLEDLDEKLNVLLQRQQDGFDPNSFIDVTYENMKQTKELANRIDEMEVKIDKIQGYMEKIVAYIEE